MTPEEIRNDADVMAATYGWDAAKRETYRQQLVRAEERKAETRSMLAATVRPPSTRAELADAGYGMGPAPSLATHASQVVDGRVVNPPVISERMSAAYEEHMTQQAARMAHTKPLRRSDGKIMDRVYELDYNVLNSVAGPTDDW